MWQRKKAVEVLQSSHDEQHLWKCIVAFQGYRFKTISGLPFSYKIKTGRNGELTKELWIDRRESSKSLTWSSVLLALGNIKGEVVDRPKALGDIRGVTYIFGMFYRFGLIDVPDEVKEKIRVAMIGRTVSAETRERMSAARKEYWERKNVNISRQNPQVA